MDIRKAAAIARWYRSEAELYSMWLLDEYKVIMYDAEIADRLKRHMDKTSEAHGLRMPVWEVCKKGSK